MDDAFRIIETMGYAPESGIRHRALHVARLSRTCHALGVPYRADEVSRALDEVAGHAPLRVRLTVARDGTVGQKAVPYAPILRKWALTISQSRLDSHDRWLRVKTTNRTLYDTARGNMPANIDEILFVNEHGALCEGTITNLFIERDGALLTPSLECGLLPGILRETLLAEGRAREAALSPEDLRTADRIFVGNSLRGLIEAEIAV